MTRTIADTLINLAYVMAGGEPVAERARLHTLQKTYRGLDREMDLGGGVLAVRRQSIPDQKSVPGLEEALALFSRKNGKERTDWAEHSPQEKLQLIGRKLGIPIQTSLSFLFYHCYRNASEVAHGTLFGIAFVYGETGSDPPPKDEQLLGKIKDDLSMLVLGVHTALQGIIAAYAKDIGRDTFAKDSDRIFNLLIEGVEARLGSDSTSTTQGWCATITSE